MNSKVFTLIFLLFTAFFGNVSAQNKSQQKDKEKSAKTPENKEKEKAISAVKIDTSKTTRGKAELSGAKLKTGLEIDSLDLSNSKLKFLKKNAHASYYANKFHGRRTASGKKFDNNGYTAAHKKLPFGTLVKVTNEANGKSVIVEITDRGPFSKAREIDLSRRAFMEIAANKNSGVVIVTIEEVIPQK